MRLTEADIDAIEQAIEQNVPLSLTREGGMVLLDNTTISFHGIYAYEYQVDYITQISGERTPFWYRCYIQENTSLTSETMPRNRRYQRTLVTWNEQNIQRQQAAAERRAAQEPVEQPAAPTSPVAGLVDRAREFVRGLYRPMADEVAMGNAHTTPVSGSYEEWQARQRAANGFGGHTGIEAPTGNVSFRTTNPAASTFYINGAEVRLPSNPQLGHTVVDSRNTYSFTYTGDGNWQSASIPRVQVTSPSSINEGEAVQYDVTSTWLEGADLNTHTVRTDPAPSDVDGYEVHRVAYSGEGLRQQIRPQNMYAYDGTGLAYSLQAAYLEQPSQMQAAMQYAFGDSQIHPASTAYHGAGGYNEDRVTWKDDFKMEWMGTVDPISKPSAPEPPMCDLFLP